MEEIYLKILELAQPYYEKGRMYDLDQIDWIMRQANLLADKLNLDKKILIPLIILHDVGYAFVDNKNPDIKDKDSKRIHLEEGVKIARKILEQINYNSELTKQILYFISVHDNWVFGDDQPYKESKLLAFFNDLDFLYAQSSYESFKHHGESMGIPVEKMYDFWMNDEKLKRRPFCCPETKALFEDLMNQRKKELLSI
jgi:putative nucleotidyltransferase with HDIG domain